MPNVFFDQEVLERCILRDGEMPCECWNPNTIAGHIMDLSRCLSCGTMLATEPTLEKAESDR